MIDKKDYEKYYKEYLSISESMKSEDISLDEAMEKYKKSKEVYGKLKSILDEAKLEIESMKD